jgi:type I restriction enzyme S subunit
MSEWREFMLEDLADSSPNALATGPFGSAISSKHFVNDGVPVIRGSNLSLDVGVRLSDDSLAYLSEETAGRFRRSIARRGDLVFTCWGTVGQVGLVDERCQFDEYVVSNKQMKLTPDPERVDSHFLYYLLSSPEMVGEVTGQAIGAAVPGFNLGQLRSLTIRLPGLGEQRSIATVLRAIDDLIENHRRRVEVLEEMARAVYREWFVRFRYPGHEHVPLVDSPLGPIPDGWTVGVLGDLAALDRVNVQPRDSPGELFDHYSIPAFDDGARPVVEPGGAIKSGKYLLSTPAVLVSKLNPRIDRVWFAEPGTEQRSVTSTEFLILRPNERSHLEHLYLLARDPKFREQLTALSGGTSGSHRRAKPADFLKLPVAVAPAAVLDILAKATSDQLRLARQLARQGNKLAGLRDLLLPKLVTGQIDVSHLDLDVLAEAATA